MTSAKYADDLYKFIFHLEDGHVRMSVYIGNKKKLELEYCLQASLFSEISQEIACRDLMHLQALITNDIWWRFLLLNIAYSN